LERELAALTARGQAALEEGQRLKAEAQALGISLEAIQGAAEFYVYASEALGGLEKVSAVAYRFAPQSLDVLRSLVASLEASVLVLREVIAPAAAPRPEEPIHGSGCR
jgi:hypothetical protein